MNISLLDSWNTFQHHVIGIVNKRLVPILINTSTARSHVSKKFCDKFENLSEYVTKYYYLFKTPKSWSNSIRYSNRLTTKWNFVWYRLFRNIRYLITSDYLLLDNSINNQDINFMKNY
jgi:hypothetical protein